MAKPTHEDFTQDADLAHTNEPASLQTGDATFYDPPAKKERKARPRKISNAEITLVLLLQRLSSAIRYGGKEIKLLEVLQSHEVEAIDNYVADVLAAVES